MWEKGDMGRNREKSGPQRKKDGLVRKKQEGRRDRRWWWEADVEKRWVFGDVGWMEPIPSPSPALRQVRDLRPRHHA